MNVLNLLYKVPESLADKHNLLRFHLEMIKKKQYNNNKKTKTQNTSTASIFQKHLSPRDTSMVAAEAHQAIKSISKLNKTLSIPPGSTDYSTNINLSLLSSGNH